ncbi:MAG: biotin carboxylase N-terminal domain-containing protein [Bdellovibrionia bacterium]
MKKVEKLGIANRGEVAVRIIRACQEMGIKSVLLHSEADTGSIAYRLADERVCIGPAAVGESYLSIERNIEAALASRVQAIHPGFGFLSENADFAQACLDNKIIFVGPSPSAIRDMGDKVNAKALAKSAGLSVIPGYEGDDSNQPELKKQAAKIGYPVIVKAAGGGGGRGLKIARDEQQLEAAVESAKREASSSFGNSRVFLEKYFEDAKHIEVQVFGDAKGHVEHLYERECSIQRRHQKIIEEAPSPTLPPEVREEIGAVACKLAQKVNYSGAGTVEFLYSKGKYYFMEMNTRLQVEHPVTELVTGTDLVKAQIQVAREEIVLLTQERTKPRGHAIECRLYAEDPYASGRPSTGKLGTIFLPQGPGRRFDIGFEKGDEITPYYDPMIGKLIVWDENRVRAIKRLRNVLEETVIFGVRTNIPLLKAIIDHLDFVSGKFNTQFMANHFPEGLTPEALEPWQKKITELARTKAGPESSGAAAEQSPWDQSWRTS